MACAFLFALLPATSPAPGADPAAVPTVRIGLLASLFPGFSEPMIKVASFPFTSLMADQAGFLGEVVVDHDARHLATQLKEDKVQLGVFHGFEFAWARERNPDLKPLLIAVNQQPFTRAVLVVHNDNTAPDPTALRGKVLAVPRLAHDHCRMFLSRHCIRKGMRVEQWFEKVATPTTACDALDDVANERASAAVVDDVDLATFRKEYPKTAAKLRVLAESEVFPCAVIAYQPGGGMNEGTLERLQAGLIEAKNTRRGRKLLELCRITGFELIPADYDKSLAEILKAYPPPPVK
jgi:ABC-type phosphate/phosphonate transport system substrate-binding protein